MKKRLTTLLAAAALAVAAGVLPRHLPLERAEVPMVKHAKGDVTTTVSPAQSVRQSFTADGATIAGVKIFSPTALPDTRSLTLHLRDQTGRTLASARLPHHTFKNHANLSYLTFSFPAFTPAVKQELTVRIEKPAGTPLELVINQDNFYPYGRLQEPASAPEIDLAFSLLHPQPMSFLTLQGIIAGLAALVGAVLIALLPRGAWLTAAVLITILAPTALAPVWFSSGEWGIADWDFYFTLHENYRRSLLDFGTFPFWNPYTCGGTAGLGDPEFPIFSLSFLLELIFGVPAGLRLAIYLSVILAGLGTLALARRLKLSPLAAFLASLGVMFSSKHLLIMAEGHVDMFAAGWLPWIFWSWLSAYQNRLARRSPASGGGGGGTHGWELLTGIFLALMFYQGGIYLLFYFVGAFALLVFLTKHKNAALSVTLRAGLWALGLSAVKLIPVLLWMREFPDEYYAPSAFTLLNLDEIFLGRYLHGADILVNQRSGWHEYGAYTGVVLLAAALIGLARRTRITTSIAIGIIAVIIIGGAGQLLIPLFDALPWLPRSNISRILYFAILGISLLAAFGLDVLRRTSASKTLPVLLIGLAAIELMSLAYPLAAQVFVVPAVVPPLAPAPGALTFTRDTHTIDAHGRHHDRTYAATLAGYGTLSYCTPIGPRLHVAAAGEPQSDILHVQHSESNYQLISFSPTRVEARVTTPAQTAVLLNNNFASGWRVHLRQPEDSTGQPAQNIDHRVATYVPPGTHDIIFAYRTPGFIPGVSLTIATLIAAGFAITRKSNAK